RFRMMEQARIAFAALDPSTNLIGYELRGERAESWCRLYNQCVSEFVQKYPDRFTAMAAVPLQEPARAARVLEHAVAELGVVGLGPGDARYLMSEASAALADAQALYGYASYLDRVPARGGQRRQASDNREERARAAAALEEAAMGARVALVSG